jgi:hypothetical protein
MIKVAVIKLFIKPVFRRNGCEVLNFFPEMTILVSCRMVLVSCRMVSVV